MADQKPKVTLMYSGSKNQYCVERIEGSRATILFDMGDSVDLARVGKWLSEEGVNSLGQKADLTIWRYVSRLDD